MPNKTELRRQWNEAGENVVVLHQFPRARVCPSPSPYPIKFETYLRIAGIKYVNDFEQPMSAKKKSPWMTFNGMDMADSQLCIEHLGKTLDKDLTAKLEVSDQVMARGLRAILEDNYYFCAAMERWAFGDLAVLRDEIMAPLPIPNFLYMLALKKFRSDLIGQARGQGIGRHTKEEVRAIGLKDLRAVSDFLGEKPYLMGDKPTEIDCTLFGFTTMILTTSKKGNVYFDAVESDMKNLKYHFERIKTKYWPDWEECKHQSK